MDSNEFELAPSCPPFRMSVLNLLPKLSGGWRPRKQNVQTISGSSSAILRQYKVQGLYVVCSIDIVKEMKYILVLKIWDILPLEDIPKLTNRFIQIISSIFAMRHVLRGISLKLATRFGYSPRCKDPSNTDAESDLVTLVSESLLLMKFYSLSSAVVNHLLSDRAGRELDLPFEVTDQEMEIILYQRITELLYVYSFACGGSHSTEQSLIDMADFDEEESQFKDIKDSFQDISPKSYPLVITFHRFLMMLNGTLSNSCFDRFSLSIERLKIHCNSSLFSFSALKFPTFYNLHQSKKYR
ncbi:unnamed protein product [Malus baccata var. baccata]